MTGGNHSNPANPPLQEPGAVRSASRWLSPRRSALGLGEHTAPLLAFVAVGMAIGPEALNVVSFDLLARFDPVVSIALAILGVFIGSGYIRVRGAGESRWVVGASLQALVTVGSVWGSMYFLLEQWQIPLPVESWEAAAVLAICSAASAALRVRKSAQLPLVNAAHLANLDDVALVVLGSIAVPVIAGAPSPLAAVGLALVAGLIIGIAGSLLFMRSENAPEYGVFVIGTILLLGGAAAYVGASPLTTGCVAGLWWAGRRTTLMDFEMQRLERPLIALLLIIAGASIQFSYALVWLRSRSSSSDSPESCWPACWWRARWTCRRAWSARCSSLQAFSALRWRSTFSRSLRPAAPSWCRR